MDAATRTVKVAQLGIDFEVLAADQVIGPAIERGAWEDHETRLFRSHLVPRERVVDLGANVGWFSCLAILAGCDVYAYEPVPHIADVCERNMRRAMEVSSGRGTLYRAAAGSTHGKATIALRADNCGDNRVFEGEVPADMESPETIEIEIEPVDARVEGPVCAMKVDTQGSEWHALQGARACIDRSPDMALLIEFWPYALRDAEPAQLLELLTEDLGFRLGKATDAPYPMKPERILRQALARDPVKGGLDLYGVRGAKRFGILGAKASLHGLWRSLRED